jgi:hypothetical protein
MARSEAPLPRTRGLHGMAVSGTSFGPAETTDLCSSSPTSFVAVKVHWTKASGHQRAGCTATYKLRATMIIFVKFCYFNMLDRRNEVPFVWPFYESWASSLKTSRLS